MSGSLHPIIVGAALVAIASSLGKGEAGAQQSKDPAAITLDLTLYDELLRMRVIRGAVSTGAADEMLRLEATVLSQRGTSDKVHRGMVAAEQREANTFFLYIEHVVAAAPHWPTDLPPEQYRAEADGLMSGVRPNYAQAIAAEQDPVESLAIAYRVLRLASGDNNMLFAKTPFEVRGSQVAEALSAAAAPIQASAATAGARPAPPALSPGPAGPTPTPAPALAPGPIAPKTAPSTAAPSVAELLRKLGFLGNWAITCGQPPSPANVHAKRYVESTGAVVQIDETAPNQVVLSYEFKTAELRPDGKLSATLEVTSTHKLESVVYQLNDGTNQSAALRVYRVWFRQNGDGVVLVRDGTGTTTHQPAPLVRRCAP